ncbi:MAG: type II 3-dehydroquinate dehydratase [Calditrichaeota bacterium]|nr:MAG: type II 3-dehydroquinate dehydratase [Calditrichota bacterium]MBL1207601.1 type II 3-dehydroquinate dehydratase [Calditrichota bacterium]NOG47434.1 type II 3-dehydroquinate dehydratase [Calditrichota bacterium]
MKILIINGPNLNLLGKRNPTVYGQNSLNEVNDFVKGYFKKVEIDFYQSNHEGEIIDKIQKADGHYAGVVLNAGAFTHYSYAIRDAIESVSVPVVEVHISNIAGREEFRHKSVISDVVSGSIVGLGIYGYVLGVQALAHQHKRK